MATRSLPVLTASMAILAAIPLGAEQPATVNLKGFGSATIDGVQGAQEWSGAGLAAFNVTLPDGSGTTPAVFYVMNDGTNLYLALALADWDLPGQSSFSLTFDNNDDGVCNEGEDAIVINSNNPTSLNDDFWNAACVTNGADDNDGGTSDGSGRVTASGATSFWEVAHPLNDSDNEHDFSLTVGSVVGYSVDVVTCGVGCVSTYYPASAWGYFGGIEIVPPDFIFVDGFESIDFSAWSYHTP